MSMWNAAAVVETLKWTVSPAFTLICVANPWSVGSPAPLTSHVDCGVPARQFSAATGLAGDVHGSAAPARWLGATSPKAATKPATKTANGLGNCVCISVVDSDGDHGASTGVAGGIECDARELVGTVATARVPRADPAVLRLAARADDC